jgi:hypothetical protein
MGVVRGKNSYQSDPTIQRTDDPEEEDADDGVNSSSNRNVDGNYPLSIRLGPAKRKKEGARSVRRKQSPGS